METRRWINLHVGDYGLWSLIHVFLFSYIWNYDQLNPSTAMGYLGSIYGTIGTQVIIEVQKDSYCWALDVMDR